MARKQVVGEPSDGLPAISRHALKDADRMREDLHETAAYPAILPTGAEMS